MFTSRSEYRLRLREDNADIRLSPMARTLGLLSDHQWRLFETKQEAILREQSRLLDLWVRPGTPLGLEIDKLIEKPLEREYRASDLLKRPELNYGLLMRVPGMGEGEPDLKVGEQIDIQAKYAGYIAMQDKEVARNEYYEHLMIPLDFDFDSISGLSNEVCEKLKNVHPQTLGQAGRIPGITPAAISLLLVYLKKRT
jgi:tRNA uridine 5-carboxymethylaminomethyl modification enzyme